LIFEIETGIIRISDPSNSKYSWNSHCLNNCKTGNWYPYLEKINNRVVAFCAEYSHTFIKTWDIDTTNFNIKCESGLFGIYDDKYYQDDSMVPDNFNFENYKFGVSRWYDMNEKQSRDNNGLGIVSFGCVIDCNKRIDSLFIHKTKKEIDGIRIGFL
jgi:hypothetical protein